ncbi:U32 family peptidase [Nitrogeniibacter mangrovi]|uniref:Ubiquinone biosynthesis protein UbiV n=1 Tax=Nitrogeniibacter mangrovi TaxID=2016596 RepID=A0A6C1B2U4_9RHOO|nr:U32 family peptidase [Nitrogeniibacter mangrovi]QID16534.1 U32 family peptidase [Nitrogeniibacter mangrovi]
MKLALGPHQYYWPRQAMLAFYASIADTPVDIVYLGESVCSRRHELRLDDWLDVAAMLTAAGKEVVLSSLVLIESESDLKTLRRLVGQAEFCVEANDMAAVSLLDAAGRDDWVAGPTLNIFNPQTLALMQSMGARRWVMPPEMSREAAVALRAGCATPPELEVTAYGRLPLAYSARCFTARHFNLQKDTCEFRCLGHTDGLRLRTREGNPFLTLNGIQTQSARIHNLLADLPSLQAADAQVLRLLPQGDDMIGIIDLFHQAVQGTLSGPTAFERSRALMTDEACNGFWHGRAGVEQYVRT